METCQEYLSAQRNGQTTFFSPTNEWCLPAPSVIKPEEREFVIDSGASMHMLSRKDLHSPEPETVRVSQNPTTVVTANGEVQTKEEATVYVGELDLFVTVMLLEDTRVVLTRKTLRRSREKLPLDQLSETTSHQKWQEDQLQHSELRTLGCPWSINKFLKLIFTCFSHIFIAGKRDSHGAASMNKK